MKSEGRRDFREPRYLAWRKAVLARDRYRCLKCGGRKKLQAHHVKRWAEYPTARYLVGNGVTLCRECHDRLAGAEQDFEALCHLLLPPPPAAAADALLARVRGRQKGVE